MKTGLLEAVRTGLLEPARAAAIHTGTLVHSAYLTAFVQATTATTPTTPAAGGGLTIGTGTGASQTINTPVGNATGIPGVSTLLSLISSLQGIGFVLAAGAVVLGAVLWSFGAAKENSRGSHIGKQLVLGGLVTALLDGVAIGLVNWVGTTAATNG